MGLFVVALIFLLAFFNAAFGLFAAIGQSSRASCWPPEGCIHVFVDVLPAILDAKGSR